MTYPDLQAHAKLIRIRPYRPSDSEQVRELFKNATVNEPTSVIQMASKAQLKGPTSYVSYSAVILGLILATFQTSLRNRCIGYALCIAGCGIFLSHRLTLFYMTSRNTKQAFNGDLKDIAKTFEMVPVIDHTGRRTGEYVPTGKSGFWVAEAYEKGSEIGDSRTEIIGSVGLDAKRTSDETSAELRRMVVSQHYRRRGIAVSLIKTAVHHAQSHDLKSVILNTTMFQPAAIAMYEKFGWVLQKKISFSLFLDRIWIFYYSLDLSTVKV